MMITITSAPQAAACTVKVPGDYPSIQDAIDLSDCDILLVEPEYHESVLIHRDVQISGTGTGPTHVIGDPEGGSVFTIAESDSSGLEVVFKNMTIRGGSAAKGGGINNHGGALVVEGCTISDNHATGLQGTGGGIYNHGGGVLLLADSTVRDNTAVLSGAGISNSGIDTSFLEGPHQRARDGVEQFYTFLKELKNVEIPSFDMSFLIPGSFQEYVGNLAELPSHLNDPVQVLVDLYPEEVLIDV